MSSDFWQCQGDSLTAPIADKQHSDYMDYLQRWQAFRHPALFMVETQQPEAGKIRLQILDRQDFKTFEQAIPSGFEKLTALSQALDVIQAGIYLSLHPKQLYFHRAGYARWLPASPAFFARQQAVGTDLPVLLASCFALQQDTEDDFTPEWRAFWQSCRQEARLQQVTDVQRLLLMAWPYLTAVRLAMKDRLLTPEQDTQLEQFGKLLGLDEAARYELDKLALQEEPNFRHYISMSS
ncbi:hypothetical protein [Candidatus Venteria ishoeyi]|uniref:Uncharacterized protein n=1 Tax=Candidatus Venteria ishoeyi TaxID=1899563 RepID=A0A1H6F4G3_9GAMM|nr:hypothetical protein [Candidatus Venteria ishoeyi]SEH04453.1 Uncharacterised protein [Candidatus Venteria ishoeyi]